MKTVFCRQAIVNSFIRFFKKRNSTQEHLTNKYLLALVLIGSTLTASYIIFTLYFKTMEMDGYFINISGRQRMLSQRIALLSHEIDINSGKAKLIRDELDSAIELMEKTHETLTNQKSLDPTLHEIYFGKSYTLDKTVRDFIARAKRKDHRSFSIEEINFLLAGLDKVVSSLQEQSEKNHHFVANIQTSVWILGLLILLFSGVFIFRPMTLEIEDKTEKLIVEQTAIRQINQSLEQRILDRTRELRDMQETSILNARQAGMAEIATGILHNIGNILNSVNIGAEKMLHILKESGMPGLRKANELLTKNIDSLADFLLNNSKGKMLPQYYLSLGQALDNDFKNLNEELKALLERIQLIKDVISSQQSFAKGGDFKEEVFVVEVVETALTMQLNALVRHDIRIIKKYEKVKPILAQKAKLVHVLLNLIKNAKEAMIMKEKDTKELTIEVGHQADNSVYIKISDNGEGIAEENLNNVFNHGFTTKKEGHGFGLHYCANALTEMGGHISVNSGGPGKGTTFTLLFSNPDILQKVG